MDAGGRTNQETESRMPLVIAHDCRDAGVRATQEAKAEEQRCTDSCRFFVQKHIKVIML